MPKFEYKNIKISDVELELMETSRRKDQIFGSKAVKSVIIDGESITPSDRFWVSLFSRFGLNTSFFKFFSHTEVFHRIAEKDSTGVVRVCIERKDTGDPRLLAATGLNKPVVIYDDLMEILERFEAGDRVKYDNGIVTSTHAPRVGLSEFKIGADKMSNQFVLSCPIDGFGTPNVFLSLLRWVCSNGMIGYARAFKTALQLGAGGDNVKYTLQRTLDSFNNDEGYAVLRGRFETAMRSWASLREQQQLYKVLLSLQNDGILQQQLGGGNASAGQVLMQRYEDVTGKPHELYFRDPNLFTSKRQRVLPVSCRVYDMFNFATEVATHNVSEASARQLQAWVGNMLSGNYDLEDSCDQFDDFRSMFVADAVKDTRFEGDEADAINPEGE